MKKLLLLLVICLPALFAVSQTKTLGGKVIDEGGNAVSFAAIQLKGTSLGVSADASGNFKLPVNDTATEIVVSATGFKTQNVSIKGLDTVVVTLARDSEQVNELAVTAPGVRNNWNEFIQRVDGDGLTRARIVPRQSHTWQNSGTW